MTKALAPAAMRDHTLSADHDSRYHTKTELQNTTIIHRKNLSKIKVKEEESVSYSIPIPGAIVGDVVFVMPPQGTAVQGVLIEVSVETDDAIALSIHNWIEADKDKATIDAGEWVFVILRSLS